MEGKSIVPSPSEKDSLKSAPGDDAPMRFPWALLVLVAAALPLVHANTMTGQGFAVGGPMDSAGIWKLYHVNVQGSPVVGSATLTWTRTALTADQFDMTLWKPGADDDGQLTPDEILATSWGYTPTPERSLSFTLPPAAEDYVFTVEPTQALGTRFALESNAVWFQDVGFTVGTKLTLP